MIPSFQDTEPRFITMLKQSLPIHWTYERYLIDYSNSFGHELHIWLKKMTCQGLDSRYGETHCIKCNTVNTSAYGFDSEALFIDCVLKEIKTIDMHDLPPLSSVLTSGNGDIPVIVDPSCLYTKTKKYKSIIKFDDTIKQDKLLLLI